MGGGLGVEHRCSIKEEPPDAVVDEEVPASTAAETRPNTGTTRRQDGVECSECGRKFSRTGDLKRHKCRAEREKPVHKQRGGGSSV